MENVEGLLERRRQFEEEVGLILGEDDQSLANWLDRVSFLLLKRYSELNAIEIATLKLSLSRVANVCSEDYRDIMKAFLPMNLYEELVALKFERCLPGSKADLIKATVAELQEEAKKPRPDFKIEYGENETSLGNQIRLVFHYLFTSLESMLKRKAEFNYVSLVDSILLHILNDTSIEVHPGETECFSTKEAMLNNELSFSSSNSSNSRIGGRKIDLLVKSKGCELGVLEFKRAQEFQEKKQKTSKGSSSKRSSLSIGQESKSVRINKCILNQLSKKGFPGDYMLGMDFNGLHGYLYSMQPLKGAHVVTLVGNLELPGNRKDLQGNKLLNSLLAIYELKEFWLRLKEEDDDDEGEEEDDDEKEEEEEEEEEDDDDDEKEEEEDNEKHIVVDKSVFFTPRLAARKL
ncbi:hypothetical protein BD560DRAFT_430403 [Blakeslea trispora]|nr:hypothetical protein BD560DRAFT_430403 [Blakeslea trispora]